MSKFKQSNRKLLDSLINDKKSTELQYYFNSIKTLLELANDRGFLTIIIPINVLLNINCECFNQIRQLLICILKK